MRPLTVTLLLVHLAACTQPPCVPAQETGLTDTGTPEQAEWTYRAWSPSPEIELGWPLQTVRPAGDDGLYILDQTSEKVLHLTRAYVHPTGLFCLDGPGTPQDCEGTVLSAGTIAASNALSMCSDASGQRIFVPKRGGRVEVAGTTRGGSSWRTYRRVYRALEPDQSMSWDPEGPCAAAGNDLILSDDTHLARVQLTQEQVLEREVETDLSSAPVALASMDDWLLVLDEAGDLSLRTTATLLQQEVLTQEVATLATDSTRHRVWVLRQDGSLLRFDLSETGAAASGDLPGPYEPTLGVDQRTGHLHLVRSDSSELVYTDGLVELGTTILPAADGHLIADPGGTGDAAIFQRLGSTVSLPAVYSPLPVPDPRPELSVFVVSTLEQPFSDADKACTAEEDPEDSWDTYLADLRANAALLAEVGVPVAIGVTPEFWAKSVDCGEDGILQELDELGMELGVMIHSKPCYSCTDAPVEGEHPVQCARTHPDYAAPESPVACWPSHPDYCDPGDDACWLAYASDLVLEVDAAIPGGAAFIHGADRHSLWSWDWVQGYRDLPRASGDTGYPATLFVGNWAYPEVHDPYDPRGKDPAPWDPAKVSGTWFSAHLDGWDSPSAFSELLVMPGNSIAVLRLGEWQETGLSVVQLGDEGVTSRLNAEDFAAATALIRHAATRRPASAPSTYYIHLSDLSAWSLEQDTPEDGVPIELLEAWVRQVDGLTGVQWSLPSQVRAAAEASP